jgi:hypothetical protein
MDGKSLDEIYSWGSFLAATAFAIHITYHTAFKATPAQLIFGRDTLLPINFKVDWAVIEQTASKKCLIITEEKMLPEYVMAIK